jgi:predicted regulator of Ras-like GTPase activity (Roadblock/LC7/MglB family)
MRLRQILEDLLREAPGARAAILADWEGESVITAGADGDDFELKVIGAHQAIFLEKLREISRRLRLGEAREIVMVNERFNIIIAAVNREYYMVLTTSAGALAAAVRPALKKARQAILEDIS